MASRDEWASREEAGILHLVGPQNPVGELAFPEAWGSCYQEAPGNLRPETLYHQSENPEAWGSCYQEAPGNLRPETLYHRSEYPEAQGSCHPEASCNHRLGSHRLEA